MLDYLGIMSKGGVVYWCRQTCPIKGAPVDHLIQNVLLEERISEKVYKQGGYTLKWRMENQFDLIFVVVYSVQLMYVDDLLDKVTNKFLKMFRDQLAVKPVRSISGFAFDNTYDRLLEKTESANDRRPRVMRNFEEAKKDDVSDKKKKENVAPKETPKDEPKVVESKPDELSAAGGGEESAADKQLRMMEKRREMAQRTMRTGPPVKKDAKKPAEASTPEKKKNMRSWGGGKLSKEEIAALSRCTDKPEDAVARPDDQDTYNPADFKDEDEEIVDSDSDDDGAAGGKKKSSSGLFSYFRTIASGKELERGDLEGPLTQLREVLITKNVAHEIADKLCDSVSSQLVGQRSQAGFGGIKKSVHSAMESALSRVLTPKQSIDVLREVFETNKGGRPYVMVFVGVNGVGKSTSLAKVCAWLMHHKQRVLIVACDTFRSGAVEQLRTHCTRLKTDLFERGYDKDPASVAMEGVKHAAANGYNVVLIDTAGRMQDNEPLMRALAKLVNLNQPDKVLFVGEALVGNDSVDQLSKFNKALIDHATVKNPRVIDGIILTKFDTIDDKVGAVVSMVYTTGQPVIFVGVGQTYHDIRQLNVKSICRSLLK